MQVGGGQTKCATAQTQDPLRRGVHERLGMTMSSRVSSSALLALFAAAICLGSTSAYPMIAEVPEDEMKCFRFNIPKDDDAHMSFMAMPSTMSNVVEEWYVDQMATLSKNRNDVDGSLARKFVDQPSDDILKDLDKFIEENGKKTGLTLKIQKPRNPRPMRQQELMWFTPAVVNHIEKYQRKTKEWQANTELDGYSVCFENHSEDNQIHVIFDVVLVSETYEELDGEASMEKKHLSPLEQELAASINAANSIISEMRYMEKRESRMRVTTESINSRIRFFSYISVAVLLCVTYLQVTYLKRYFKKKKLM